MPLTERKEIGQITVLPDGQIQVREDTVYENDGVEQARKFHRHVIHPGMDLSSEDARVRDVATVVHTPQVIADFLAAEAARRTRDGVGLA